MLNTLELLDLEDKLMYEFSENLSGILAFLNRTDRLSEVLELMGLSKLLPQESYKPYKSGKIVVVGGTEVKEKILLGIAKGLGIDKDRFEFCLDYEAAQKFNYKKMQYNPSYSLVIFGPVGHSGHEKGDYSSVIAALENKEGYPPVMRAGSNTLKLTKNSFKECLQESLNLGYII